jgi:hypothetical protein
VRHVFLTDNISVQEYTDWGYGYGGGWPYGYGYYGMWAGAPSTYVDVSTYTEGTMILDVVDTHTKKLVFRGTGTAVVGGPKQRGQDPRGGEEDGRCPSQITHRYTRKTISIRRN